MANVFTRGDRVIVARGKKVPIGTTGVVFWSKYTEYGWRIGIQPDGMPSDGQHGVFVAATNCEYADNFRQTPAPKPTRYGKRICFDGGMVVEITAEHQEWLDAAIAKFETVATLQPMCPDCGASGESKGHQTCQYPSN